MPPVREEMNFPGCVTPQTLQNAAAQRVLCLLGALEPRGYPATNPLSPVLV